MMRGRKTLRERIEGRIARRPSSAFLTREFRDLGDERQVLRALRTLVEDRKLIRLGYGTYAHPRAASTDMGMSVDRFAAIAGEVLDKLRVPWEPGDPMAAATTQPGINPVVRVRGHFSRRLRYSEFELVVERR